MSTLELTMMAVLTIITAAGAYGIYYTIKNG